MTTVLKSRLAWFFESPLKSGAGMNSFEPFLYERIHAPGFRWFAFSSSLLFACENCARKIGLCSSKAGKYLFQNASFPTWKFGK